MMLKCCRTTQMIKFKERKTIYFNLTPSTDDAQVQNNSNDFTKYD